MSKTRPSVSTQVGNARENVGLLPNEIGHLVTWVMEKVEVLNAFIASVFLAALASRNPRDHGERLEQGRCTLWQKRIRSGNT